MKFQLYLISIIFFCSLFCICKRNDVSTTRPEASKIVFQSNRDGNTEIYVMNDDGSDQIRLTCNEFDDQHPCFSNDGSLITFSSNRDGNWEIYKMYADGSEQTRLTTNNTDDDFPRWSPDGSQIAFSSRRTGRDQIYIMNVDGRQVRCLSESPAEDGTPSWSPDGIHIVFESNSDGQNENIFKVLKDGSNRKSVLSSDEATGFPDWSPDGKIVFERDRHDIAVVAVSGPAMTILSDGKHQNRHPRWSHAGTKILFESVLDNNWDIYIMDADGKTRRRLTFQQGMDRFPSGAAVQREKY